ncbi:SH3 domain-containing protein [Aurantimonas sp. VKM B-3413]|uniref:SH3 domain-containing protein n=1 Tax=Aurantimonas sp. VKM B-3413 TaxID=2779401 RepID=UPI001E5E92EF|nr:SH3 domain-containing protein [Aurantimonas sp. VKM B-3413]MCB8835865.1 SH3 domain-containing protein [Aurantimonas sp. VKM B-3413]
MTTKSFRRTTFLSVIAAALLAQSPASASYVCGLNPNGDNYLSMRSGPSSRSRELLRLAPGTYLEIQAARGSWYKVVANGSYVGWVFSQYVCD